MREILKELDDKITNEDLDMMIEEIDSDGSGTVDFDGKYFENHFQCIKIINSILCLLDRIHGSDDRW